MNHDDGNSITDVDKSDIILLGVSRTSKTPTSIYLANRGFKTSNIPLVNESSIPDKLKQNPKYLVLSDWLQKLIDFMMLEKIGLSTIKENESTNYTRIETIENELNNSKKLFKKYQWPIIDVTRKSVEETAASVIKIHEIYTNKK